MEQTKRYHTISCSTRWFLIGLTLLAFALRLPGLFANSFHADEALFAGWARLIAVWRDPLLQTQLVDKPPLLFYLQALFYPLQGAVMWAARLPNWIASILLVPLVGQWVWRWYRAENTAVFAAVLLALSPLAIQFSPTAFLDPLLLFWLVGSLALIDRPGRSGLLFGLALLTKHQAWLFLPLLLALGWWRWRMLPDERGSDLPGWQLQLAQNLSGLRHWLAGMLPLLALLLIWEWLRSGSLTLWTLQASNFGGTRLIWSWELWPRLLAWLDLLQFVWAGNWPGMLLILLLAGGMGWLWYQSADLTGWQSNRPSKIAPNLSALVPDRLLILFTLAYLATHWLLAIPVWDRYLLLLVPILAVLLARFVTMILSGYELNSSAQWLGLFLLLLLLPGAWAGRNGRFPVGGQVGADQGIAAAALHLEEAPYGTVLYDHWHSWQWRTHLFDKRVHLSWVPHPAHLSEELLVFGRDGHARYLALATGPQALPMRRAVTDAGFCLEQVYQSEGIELLLIVNCE